MSSARQYDYGKPADTLSEWTSKVKSLQTLVDQDDAEERTRLEREIERARLERARRRGQSVDLTTPQSTASAPTAPPKPEPVSLAAFIGGKATGPRLTKKLRPDDPVDLTDYDPKPYSSKVSPLAQVARGRGGPAESSNSRGVPMPGMRSELEASVKVASRTNPVNPISTLSQRNVSSGPTPASPTVSSKTPPASKPAGSGDGSRQLSAPQAGPPLASFVNKPLQATQSTDSSLSVNKVPSTPSSLAHANAAAVSDGSAKALTPSLTRLQSRGLVGERLKAAESGVKDAKPEAATQLSANLSSPPAPTGPQELRSKEVSPPLRKKPVLDRWPPASSSPNENFPSASGGSESESSVGAAGSRNPNSLERTRAITLEPPRSLRSSPSSVPPPSGTSPTSRSFEERVSIARSINKTPDPVAANPARARGPSDIQMTHKATSAEPNASAPQLRPATTTAVRSSPTPLSKSTEPGVSLLNHPTKDRARKPKKASSAPVTDAEQANADCYPAPRFSKLSQPPQFRPNTVSEPTTPRPASASVPRSQKLSPPPMAPQPRSLSTTTGDTVSALLETWGDKTPIGIKQVSSVPRTPLAPNELRRSVPSSITSSATKRALPGMAKPAMPSVTSIGPGPTPAGSSKPMGRRSPSPASRPTAMEMAQALNLVDASPSLSDETPAPGVAGGAADAPASTGRQPSKRRSSYSPVATALPTVAEVDTPPPSLSRTQGGIIAAKSNVSAKVSQDLPKAASEPITFRHTDKPLPKLDVRNLLEKAASSPPLSFDPSFKPISTDVLCIRGRSASPVTTQPHVFYDAELRAIIYRSKDVANGLATTTIWTWHGKVAKVGNDEIWKIRDLESRFATKVISCNQGLEPLELIGLLGGVIAIRQGSATHWSAENTAMHIVRPAPYGSNVIITELDLHIQNLCSGYSYIISVMNVIYVWHGRGSRPNEASHAAAYASLLSDDSTNVIEFKEGQEDPMFWACLGDEAWANADYWGERSRFEGHARSPTWKVDFSGSVICEPLPTLNEDTITQDVIYVIDGIFEVFVVVGTNARGDRASIRLALEFAQSISAHVAHNRPFAPPVHVVILPSQLPLDLRAGHLQVSDESRFNGGFVPDHMNVLTADEASFQLAKTTWAPAELEDDTFLPLGIAPSTVQ